MRGEGSVGGEMRGRSLRAVIGYAAGRRIAGLGAGECGGAGWAGVGEAHDDGWAAGGKVWRALLLGAGWICAVGAGGGVACGGSATGFRSRDWSVCGFWGTWGKTKSAQAEQAAEKLIFGLSGIKTREENAAIMSRTKARPPKSPTSSAACEACAIGGIEWRENAREGRGTEFSVCWFC